MKNANTKLRASSVSKLRARLLKSWAEVSVLAASLLFIGLLTGCPHNQPSAVDQPPAKPVDPIFKTDGNGKITGYKCAQEALPANLVIPAKIGDEEIKEIDRYAFSGCTGLTSISLPASIIKIGEYAFSGCTGITSITLPANLTEIDYSAFSGCTGITSLTIDSANTKYKTEGNILYSKDGTTLIFAAGGLTSANIPYTVTTIGKSAFRDCTGLTSVHLPVSITEIKGRAFEGCTGLTSLTIVPANTTYKTEGNILYNKAGTILIFAAGGLTSANILDTVTTIDDRAFYGCTGLTSITLPESITRIYSSAFEGCTGLTSAVFKDTNGWKVYNGISYIDILKPIYSSHLENAATAATYLREKTDKGGYCDKYWKKR